MRVVVRLIALVLATAVVLSLISAPERAEADYPPTPPTPLMVGVPSSVLSAASGGSPLTGALYGNLARLADPEESFAVPIAEPADLRWDLPSVGGWPGTVGKVITAYSFGTVLSGNALRSSGVDPEGVVCSSSDGLGQGVLALATGNDCNGWNLMHPSFVPNQDQTPTLSTDKVCDSGTVVRCFQIVGSFATVNQGVSSTTACFKNTNYTGWVGLSEPISYGVWDTFNSGTLTPVGTSLSAIPTACRALGANYYGSSSVWGSPGFVFAFYTGRTNGSIKPGSTSATLTKTYPDPERFFRCEILGSNFQTYYADSETFIESGAVLPQVVCPDLPIGVHALWQTIYEMGGGHTLTVVNQPTSLAYQDWSDDYSSCTSRGCSLDLYKNGESCFLLQDECDGWVNDPFRASTYACVYDGWVVAIEECFIYGTMFNQAARDSGHAYADPATGLPILAQTSPNLEEQIVESLIGRMKAQKAWTTLPQDQWREGAEAIAAQCIALEVAHECISMAIFAPGLDVQEAAEHDLQTIQANPALIQLTYMSTAEKAASGTPQGWYSPSLCVSGAEAGKHCDEYPFYASAQGAGFGTSVTQISATHNMLEELLYGSFVTDCGLGSADADRNFVVIPEITYNTAYWCAN